jgi:hypothetical protein
MISSKFFSVIGGASMRGAYPDRVASAFPVIDIITEYYLILFLKVTYLSKNDQNAIASAFIS